MSDTDDAPGSGDPLHVEEDSGPSGVVSAGSFRHFPLAETCQVTLWWVSYSAVGRSSSLPDSQSPPLPSVAVRSGIQFRGTGIRFHDFPVPAQHKP